MPDVVLTYPTRDGTEEISLSEGRVSFGRGSDADVRFQDDGLSRLHASVYSERGRVWIVDENSSNGTFVNGTPVEGPGTPLKDGDTVKMGHQTNITVRFVPFPKEPHATPAVDSANDHVVSSSPSPANLLPVFLIAIAILIVSVSAVMVAFKVFGLGQESSVVASEDERALGLDDEPSSREIRDSSPSNNRSRSVEGGSPTSPTILTERVGDLETQSAPLPPPSAPKKKYLDMTDRERREYISERSMRIAQIIGNRATDRIPPAAVEKIKAWADAYATRVKSARLPGCRFGDNLQATYERASKNAPFIVRAFNEKGIDPRIGIYLAMIESEHCVCLQSPTGPLGMFQFTKSTGELHGLRTKTGASPSNPDERCEPEPSARAAASYMKALTGRFGTGPSSVPLAIGSYNSGEGGLSSNLVKALDSNSGLERDFWTLISKAEILSAQFQSENFKYVPKFFAAAIVGEYPQDFGLDLQPLSTYTR